MAVCHSDASPTSWVWTAYASSSGVTVPDAPNVSTLDGDISAFALNTRRAIQFSTDRVADYFTLAGRAKRIGAAIPQGVQTALHAVITDPARTVAPAVLLLTEELYVPWELGTITPALSTRWGGASPFLGAHAAIGRWPLSEQKPRPAPRSRVDVRAGAVVTADYTGVPGWESSTTPSPRHRPVAELFTPPATSVAPDLVGVIDLLRGSPPADVVHVALHGQFDSQGDQEGIVLLTRDAGGSAKPVFLTPIEVENGDLAAGPLVFLNACQVGADKRVLGSYGGFATTLLRIGASAVVAPLWNIDDDVAGSVAATFYEQVLGRGGAGGGRRGDARHPGAVHGGCRRVRHPRRDGDTRRLPGLRAPAPAAEQTHLTTRRRAKTWQSSCVRRASPSSSATSSSPLPD